MSRARRNRNFIKANGEDITKMPRTQTGEDESGNPVYEYLSEDETTIRALTKSQGADADRFQRSLGSSEKEIMTIIISDEVNLNPNTRFRIDGFEYSIRQRKPSKKGKLKVQIERNIVQ